MPKSNVLKHELKRFWVNTILMNYRNGVGGNILENMSQLRMVVGVSKAEDEMRMKRMIFRISKGRAIPSFFDLDQGFNQHNNIGTGEHALRKMFMIFFQGGEENVMLGRIIKICDLFSASRYDIPKKEDILNALHMINEIINEKKTFLLEAEGSLRNFIRDKVGTVSIS